ncbi:hypothetical protein [Nocardia sp. NPDC127526]|uniref:hypothetical protein n=1 Tax=Nocardia sp. NPDC127526 TaxID=3345393 RepID=UPI003633ADAF
MSSPAASSLSSGVSGRAVAALAALAAVLAAAFVLAPRALAASGPGDGFADEEDIRASFRAAFVEYWGSGSAEFPSGLARVVDFWFHYHVVKAVIAALLLIALAWLGVLLWKAFLSAGGVGAGRKAVLGAGGVVATVLALFSVVLVMANIQGAVAPFASLLPMLTDGTADAELAATLDQVRQGLAESADGPTAPALDVMISDFARYHVVMAVIAAVVAVVLIGLSVLSWIGVARSSDPRTRRVLGSFGALSAVLSLAAIVVAVANTTTAADSAPALAALFEGGW